MLTTPSSTWPCAAAASDTSVGSGSTTACGVSLRGSPASECRRVTASRCSSRPARRSRPSSMAACAGVPSWSSPTRGSGCRGCLEPCAEPGPTSSSARRGGSPRPGRSGGRACASRSHGCPGRLVACSRSTTRSVRSSSGARERRCPQSPQPTTQRPFSSPPARRGPPREWPTPTGSSLPCATCSPPTSASTETPGS